jgi:hypothetical protein
MPDIFASVGLISVALLFGYADRMSISERLGLTALIAISAVFHITHLMTAAVVGFAGLAATFGLQPQRIALWRRSVLVTASALAVAITMNFAFDATARAVLGASPKRPPLLTARVIVDGPGRLYLDDFCPIEDEFAVCAYRHRGFRTADEFLWGVLPTGVFSTLPLDQRLKIIEQEPRFIAAVFRQYPLAVFKAIVANAVEQLTLVLPAEAYIDPGKQFGDLPFRNADLFEVAPFLNDCVAQVGSCVPTIPQGLIAAIVGMTTVLSLGVIALHFGLPSDHWQASRRSSVPWRYCVHVPDCGRRDCQCGNMRCGLRAARAISGASHVAPPCCSRYARSCQSDHHRALFVGRE